MKLRIEPIPDGYREDKAAILTDHETGEPIMIGCTNAAAVAKQIRRAVNFHEPMVAVLTPFSSKHMGQLLIDALEASMAEIDKAKGDVVRTKLSRLINAVDVILKGIELMEERDGGDE